MLTTQADLCPPANPPLVVAGYEEPDDLIREIGDAISVLTPQSAKKLESYLLSRGIKWPHLDFI